MPLCTMKATAKWGDSARRMLRSSAMWLTPSTPSTRNHTTMIGPNTLPTAAVPRFCTANRATRMATAMGMM